MGVSIDGNFVYSRKYVNRKYKCYFREINIFVTFV